MTNTYFLAHTPYKASSLPTLAPLCAYTCKEAASGSKTWGSHVRCVNVSHDPHHPPAPPTPPLQVGCMQEAAAAREGELEAALQAKEAELAAAQQAAAAQEASLVAAVRRAGQVHVRYTLNKSCPPAC